MADIIYADARKKAMTGVINFGTDTFKVALLNSSYVPSAAHTNWTDVSSYEITGTNYVAGGATLADVTVTETNGVAKWTFTSPTQAGGAFTCRYAVIYDTSAGNQLIKLIDLGLVLTCVNGFTLSVPAAGVLTQS